MTNGRRVAAPRTPGEAVSAISNIIGEAVSAISNIIALPGIQLLAAPVEVVSRWIALAGRIPVTGGKIFDLQIVASMQANDLNRIYTFNLSDFEPFPELTVIAPSEGIA